MTRPLKFIAVGLASLSLLSFGTSMSSAQGTIEQRQACTHDAIRLCSSEIPDVPRITACMMRNMKELTPACRAQFGHQQASQSGSSR